MGSGKVLFMNIENNGLSRLMYGKMTLQKTRKTV